MPPLPDLKDDERTAKLLAKPGGRLVFAAAFGVMFFESVNQLRNLVSMAEAWAKHVIEPARQRSLEEMRAAGVVDDEGHDRIGVIRPDFEPEPEIPAAQIDEDASAEQPADDPTSEATSWARVKDNPQA